MAQRAALALAALAHGLATVWPLRLSGRSHSRKPRPVTLPAPMLIVDHDGPGGLPRAAKSLEHARYVPRPTSPVGPMLDAKPYPRLPQSSVEETRSGRPSSAGADSSRLQQTERSERRSNRQAIRCPGVRPLRTGFLPLPLARRGRGSPTGPESQFAQNMSMATWHNQCSEQLAILTTDPRLLPLTWTGCGSVGAKRGTCTVSGARVSNPAETVDLRRLDRSCSRPWQP